MGTIRHPNAAALAATPVALALLLTGAAPHARAAEAFQVRYNVSGTLAPDLFSPAELPNWVGSLVVTSGHIRKVTGDDGNALVRTLPGGTVPLPAPTPAALYPTYGPSNATINARGELKQVNLALAYSPSETYGGGRLVMGLNLPYGKREQSLTGVGAAPPLNFNPALPAATRAAVTAQFGAQYQAGLAAQAAAETGEVTGLGDAELVLAWRQQVRQDLRLLASTTLVVPTGKYSAAAGADIGYGDFYTLRTEGAVTYFPIPELAVSGKVVLGLNTRNRDNDLRSGNWGALELAAGYRTPVGVVGAQVMRVQQLQDDSNNAFGASRLRLSHAGVFFTTAIVPLRTAITLQYMGATDSRNARHGSVVQLRVSRAF